MPGAEHLLAAARDAGIKTCLSTGFSPATRDAIVAALDWELAGRPVPVPGRRPPGRPWPDMPLAALLRLGGGSVHELAVVGDTPSDVEAGLRAGAGLVAGVLTGDSPPPTWRPSRPRPACQARQSSSDSVAGLAPHLGLRQRDPGWRRRRLPSNGERSAGAAGAAEPEAPEA